jgi:CheY-like chemotaxis protein
MARILIGDGEPEFIDMVAMRLQNAGHEVITGSDGRDGVSKTRAEEPDLILMDVMLPNMDGGDAARAIHDTLGLPSTPIIFLTVLVDKNEGAVSSGDEAFMPKTGNSEALLNKIKEFLP